MNEEEDQVLAANEVFYAAIRGSDLDTMESLWSDVQDVAVIHPGWAPIFGYAGVMDSWRRIFAGPEPPELYCDNARVLVFGS
jgi:ketosteroid isomerase-like protein